MVGVMLDHFRGLYSDGDMLGRRKGFGVSCLLINEDYEEYSHTSCIKRSWRLESSPWLGFQKTRLEGA